MDKQTKKTLTEQLELLAKRSKNADDKTLIGLTAQMISLVESLSFGRGSLSGGAVALNSQCVVQLSESDLEALVEARRERERLFLEEEMEWCKRHGVQVVPDE